MKLCELPKYTSINTTRPWILPCKRTVLGASWPCTTSFNIDIRLPTPCEPPNQITCPLRAPKFWRCEFTGYFLQHCPQFLNHMNRHSWATFVISPHSSPQVWQSPRARREARNTANLSSIGAALAPSVPRRSSTQFPGAGGTPLGGGGIGHVERLVEHIPCVDSGRCASRRIALSTPSYRHASATSVSKSFGRCKTTAALISLHKPSTNWVMKNISFQDEWCARRFCLNS